jgi:hypothetical protein
MRATTWMWLGPVAFLVHDAEEAAVLAPWLREHGRELPAFVQPVFNAVTTRQFVVALGILAGGYAVASAVGVWSVGRGERPLPWLLATGAFVANGFTHVMQTAIFGGYTPGLVTALLVSLPYGWLAARALRRDHVVPPRLLVWMLAAGLLVQVPMVLLVLSVVRA